MTAALYPKWKEAILQASANSALTATNVRVSFVDTAVSGGYTYANTHEFYTSLAGNYPAGRGGGAALASKTYTNGIFDAADVTFTALSNSSVSVEGIVIYIDTGTDGTSRLVSFVDEGVTGLAFTPSGSDVTIQWNASGIFQL